MSRLLMLMLLGASIILSGCEKKEAFPPPETSTKDTQQPPATNSETATEQSHTEFINKAHKELDELDTKLVALRNKAEAFSGEAKINIELQIKSLEQEQNEAKQKLTELQSATVEKWEILKQGAVEAIDHFKQAIDKAKANNS